MKHYLWLGLLAVLTACGGVVATPTIDPAPTQTREAELAQLATLTAPTPTPAAMPTPVATTTPTPRPATPTPLPTFTPAATATPRPTPTLAVTATPTSPPSTPLQVGQIVTLPGTKQGSRFQATIEGVEERTELPEPYSGPGITRARGKFVIVAMRVENQGNESDYVPGSAVRLRDGRGRLFDVADTGPHRGAERLTGRKVLYETVQPGLGLDTAMVFDVAPDAENFTLVVRTGR